MNRAITLAGYGVLAATLVVLQLSALRARRQHLLRRPLTLGELMVAVVQRSHLRWPLLAAWLWLGWRLFARVDWR